MNIVDLAEADHPTVGGKAAPLAELVRLGFRVPEGFVVSANAYRTAAIALGLPELSVDRAEEARSRILNYRLPEGLVGEVSRALERVTLAAQCDYVAVRSSSTAEDGAQTSAAGQHDSVLGVRGTEQVCRAILRCWASTWSDRAVAYRAGGGEKPPIGMAVLVQRFVDASVSGIMFTGATSVVEASWGIGERIVAGQVTPDSWRVADSGVIERRPGLKVERTDRHGEELVTGQVAAAEQRKLCLTDREVLQLHALGAEVSAALGTPRDIEWAIANDATWLLQARPVTAAIPRSTARPRSACAGGITLIGQPASPGVASGPVRLVRGPGDFADVKHGDVLVCENTDPAWTPLFTLAAAVVTETGGILSHAAIVAREVGIPAVLAVPRATDLLIPSVWVTVDGDSGGVALRE